MNRKLKLLVAALIPISFVFAKQDTAGTSQSSTPYEIHRQRAVDVGSKLQLGRTTTRAARGHQAIETWFVQ